MRRQSRGDRDLPRITIHCQVMQATALAPSAVLTARPPHLEPRARSSRARDDTCAFQHVPALDRGHRVRPGARACCVLRLRIRFMFPGWRAAQRRRPHGRRSAIGSAGPGRVGSRIDRERQPAPTQRAAAPDHPPARRPARGRGARGDARSEPFTRSRGGDRSTARFAVQLALHVRRRSSSASRIGLPMRPRWRSSIIRAAPTTRCSCTAGSASARPISLHAIGQRVAAAA